MLWHFSPVTLTLIYATYAFGVLGALLLAGGVSDDVGRRPVALVVAFEAWRTQPRRMLVRQEVAHAEV